MKQFDPRSNSDTITFRLLDAQLRRIADFVRCLTFSFWANCINKKKLTTFWYWLRFLDPACGCGNFLVVPYQELRRLNLEVVRTIRLRTGQLVTNTDMLKNVWLTQFHGLEIKPVSALIAQTALWLTEHQCNWKIGQRFYSKTLKEWWSLRIFNLNSLLTQI